MTFTTGQTVKYTGAQSNREGLWRVEQYDSYSGVTATALSGQNPSRLVGVRSSVFEATTEKPAKFEVGARVSINRDGADGASVNKGDEGTIVRHSGGVEWRVKMDNPVSGRRETGSGGHWYFVETSMTLLSPAPVTLDEYRVTFMTAALARAADNSPAHVEQVTAALDNLARVEFIDPSKTVEDFQKRVVALGMEAKGKHGWCDEPEKFFKTLGLGHLLPVTKQVKMEVYVLVTAPAGSSDADLRRQARKSLTLPNPSSDYVNSSEVVG